MRLLSPHVACWCIKDGGAVSESGKRAIVQELGAIKTVADALEPLGPEAQLHVIEYVTQALGIPASQGSASPSPRETPGGGSPAAAVPAPAPPQAEHAIDIRTLKEQKKPRSANEMAALVAYYVSELLPPSERQAYITTADVERYFKQANFPLPGRVGMTLPNAASGGYFDSVGRGQWRLNPVGYNLVAHGMPSGSNEPAPAKRTRRVTPAKRGAKKVAKRAPKPAKASKRKAIAKKPAAKRR
jgi:hypothetical protein